MLDAHGIDEAHEQHHALSLSLGATNELFSALAADVNGFDGIEGALTWPTTTGV